MSFATLLWTEARRQPAGNTFVPSRAKARSTAPTTAPPAPWITAFSFFSIILDFRVSPYVHCWRRSGRDADRRHERGPGELRERRGGRRVVRARLRRIHTSCDVRDVHFHDDIDDKLGHAHAVHCAAGLFGRELDALHRLSQHREDDH